MRQWGESSQDAQLFYVTRQLPEAKRLTESIISVTCPKRHPSLPDLHIYISTRPGERYFTAKKVFDRLLHVIQLEMEDIAKQFSMLSLPRASPQSSLQTAPHEKIEQQQQKNRFHHHRCSKKMRRRRLHPILRHFVFHSHNHSHNHNHNHNHSHNHNHNHNHNHTNHNDNNDDSIEWWKWRRMTGSMKKQKASQQQSTSCTPRTVRRADQHKSLDTKMGDAYRLV